MLGGDLEAEAWEIRGFLAKHVRDDLGPPLRLKGLSSIAANFERYGIDRQAFLNYVDVVVQTVDEDGRLAYLKDLILEKSSRHACHARETWQLLAIYRLLQHIKGEWEEPDLLILYRLLTVTP